MLEYTFPSTWAKDVVIFGGGNHILSKSNDISFIPSLYNPIPERENKSSTIEEEVT